MAHPPVSVCQRDVRDWLAFSLLDQGPQFRPLALRGDPRRDLAAVVELLRSGADPSHRGRDGITPLMMAAGFGQAQMVDLLITARTDIHAIEPRMGATALHEGAQSGNADVIQLLLDHGAFITSSLRAREHP